MDIDNKINDLISQMTLEEKVELIHGRGLFKTGEIKRLNIPSLKMSDGPMGVRNEFLNDEWQPLYDTDDYVTYLPSNTALAATWNVELAYKEGQILGSEARGRGKDIILAPGINIIRSPLCGRNFEYMSEDPCLISNMAVPLIKGIQENDIAACVKHFAMNNQETERMSVNIELDERSLREIYLKGFEASIKKGNSYTIMSAYNKFQNEFCSHNKYLLDTILRDEWNFDGVVISDWGAVHDTYKAANCSLDIEMDVKNNFDEYVLANPLIKAIKAGQIDEVEIDTKVKRILKLMYKLKKFDDNRLKGNYNSIEHIQGTLQIARESILLLKNENILPLDETKIKKLAIIGENAQKIHSNGGGSAEIKALYEISPILGLKSKLGGNIEINYATGYSSDKTKSPTEIQNLFDEAVEIAKNSDTVIFIGGLNHDFDCEGADRKDINLPYNQAELILKLIDINPNTVIVIVSGSAVKMINWANKAKAIIQNFYSGMESGNALAEIILGYTNPSAKLPITLPKNLEYADDIFKTQPDETVNYNENLMIGYRYYDKFNIEPQYCFGHGLSYTKFKYSNLNIICNDNTFELEFDIQNIGKLDGKEIAQIYVCSKNSTVEMPIKQLKAFKKVSIEPNQKVTLNILLEKDAFSYYDTTNKCWKCEKGEFEILIGSSSQDIRLSQSIKIENTIIY